VAALDRDGVDLFVFDLQVDALVDLVTAPPVAGIDPVPGLLLDQLLAKAVAGLLIDLSEGDPLRSGRRRLERDRTRDEGKLEVALPIRTRRGHGNSYSTRYDTL
jgi:hypothetical protein